MPPPLPLFPSVNQAHPPLGRRCCCNSQAKFFGARFLVNETIFAWVARKVPQSPNQFIISQSQLASYLPLFLPLSHSLSLPFSPSLSALSTWQTNLKMCWAQSLLPSRRQCKLGIIQVSSPLHLPPRAVVHSLSEWNAVRVTELPSCRGMQLGCRLCYELSINYMQTWWDRGSSIKKYIKILQRKEKEKRKRRNRVSQL